MNLTISCCFAGGYLEGRNLPHIVDVAAGHRQGVYFIALQRHSKQRDERCYKYQGVSTIPSILRAPVLEDSAI